jgi:hypothetical protein
MDNAFVNDAFFEQQNADSLAKQMQQHEKEEQIKKDDKIIQKSKTTVKNLMEEQIKLNQEIDKVSNQIKSLLKDKNLSEEGEKVVKNLMSERLKLEKKNEILFRQQQNTENKIKVAKNDKFNQTKKKND